MKLKYSIIINYFQIVIILYFIFSVVVAIIINPDYLFFYQFLSILGTGRHGWVFNIPVMLLGVVSIPFYYVFYRRMKHLYNLSIFFNLGIILGEITSLLLFLIGYFPVEGEVADIHNSLALLYFILLMIQMIFFSIATVSLRPKSTSINNYEDLLIHLRYLGIAIAFSVLLGLVGPSLWSYTLQKIIVILTLSFLTRISVFLHNLEEPISSVMHTKS